MIAKYATRTFLRSLFPVGTPRAKDGLVLDFNGMRLPWGIRHGMLRSEWEMDEIAAVRDVFQPGKPAIEYGCGLGVVSCEIARRIGPDAGLSAYDLDPRAVHATRRALSLNRLGNGIVRVASLVRDRTVEDGSWNPGSRGVQAPAAAHVPLTESVEDGCNVLIDVEGTERDVLNDPRELTALARAGAVVMELHPRIYGARTAAALCRRVESADFTEAWANGNVRGWVKN